MTRKKEKCFDSIVFFLLVTVLFPSVCFALEKPVEVDIPFQGQDLEAETIVFGFNLCRSLKEDIQKYVPFLKYLSTATGYKFRLRFIQKDASIADDLGRGVIQLAAVCAGTYILANEKYGVVPLARGVSSQGKSECQAVIVVAPDSPMQTIEDVRGKRLVFGSKTSTQGHLIPLIIFARHNISLDDFVSYEWTGSSHNCAEAVASGEADVCGMQDELGKELAREGFVRILFASSYYPSSGIVAGKNFDSVKFEKIKKALIEFEPGGAHAQGLYHWDKTAMPNGFVEAKDEDYQELREWSRKLGLLE